MTFSTCRPDTGATATTVRALLGVDARDAGDNATRRDAGRTSGVHGWRGWQVGAPATTTRSR